MSDFVGSMPVNTGKVQGTGQTYKKPCRDCGHENTFLVPPFEIVNSAVVSMLVFPHQEPQYCEKCNKAYQFVIGQVGEVAYGFLPIKDPKGQIITPPKGIIVPNA